MSVRETSIEAYRQLTESGELTRKEGEAAQWLSEFGPCTVNELFRRVGLRCTTVQSNLNSTVHRLREIGVARELPKRPCAITGKMAYVYEVTGQRPAKSQKRRRSPCPHCGGSGYERGFVPDGGQGELFQ